MIVDFYRVRSSVWLEQGSLKPRVAGSNPAVPAKILVAGGRLASHAGSYSALNGFNSRTRYQTLDKSSLNFHNYNMNFQKVRLLRELKKKYAHEIAANQLLMSDYTDEEMLETLMAMELDSAIAGTINTFIEVDDSEVMARMMSHVLGSAIGRILNETSKKNEGLSGDIYHNTLEIIKQFWSKDD